MFDFLKQQPIPDNFDYKRKKREIGQKAEVANQLRGFRPSELQFLPGGYTAGGMTNPLSTIATIAANVAGAKLLANSQKEMDALDDAGDKLYRQGIQALKDVRDTPTEAEKNAVQDIKDVQIFANDPLLPYDIKDKTPAPVAQTSPVAAPATVEAKPLEPVAAPGRRALPRSTAGAGRGAGGGPTAAELAAHNAVASNAARIDAENLQSPMQVFPSNDIGNAMRSPWMAGRTTAGQTYGDNIGREEIGPGGNLTPQQIERMAEQGSDTPMKVFRNATGLVPNRAQTGQFLGENMGIDKIGVAQMTPQQIEAQVRDSSKPYIPPESVLPAETAARQAAAVGGGRGVQGGRSFADLEAVRQQVARDAARQTELDRQVELDTLGQQYRADNQQELANFAERKGKVLSRSIQDRTEEAKSMLSRSGERGQKLVDAMDTAMLNNLLSPEDDRKNLIVVGDRLYNVKTKQFVNDGKPQVFKEGDYVMGAGGLVRVGGGAGSKIKETKDTPAGILAIYEDGSTKILNSTSNASAEKQKTEEEKKVYAEKKQKVAREVATRIDELISSGMLEQAGASVWNAAGNYANRTFGFQSNTAEARATIDGAIKGKLAEFILKRFQDEGVSANKLGDTKKELDLHISSIGPIDYERLSPKALETELKKIAREMMVVAEEKPYFAAGAYKLDEVNTQRSPSGRPWPTAR